MSDDANDDEGNEASGQTGTGEGEAGTDTEVDTDEGATFVSMPDMGSGGCEVPGSDECGPGMMCTLIYDSGWMLACVEEVEDPVAAGEPCFVDTVPYPERVDPCESGSTCWDVMEDGWGTCLAFCGDGDGDWGDEEDVCPAKHDCNFFKDLNGFGLCTPVCTPLEDDCPETCGCFWTGDAFWCVPLSESIPTGQPCSYINDCARDNICLDAAYIPGCEGSACCGHFCDLDQPECATEGTQCVAFFDEGTAPLEMENIGICIDPEAG
ncbi:hypothetical protein G6O69_23710 [Pseudenhygromyxa sp. WMMC2535]|uniref:hypothetical protein n=1 Tax=Pseudenhygromyxa sp. WMMC2535 TaxID=2712867 RepID=UPI001558331F|nr:hypothetical protein [Pseudenhygromyxa sp. WMMC2535]NVB40866.1 hypothetical protein [Pseudenhygromyxa sp. WMMC2535]